MRSSLSHRSWAWIGAVALVSTVGVMARHAAGGAKAAPEELRDSVASPAIDLKALALSDSAAAERELAARLKVLADRAQDAFDAGGYPALPDSDVEALRAQWPTLPAEPRRPLEGRWSDVKALYDSLAALKTSGVDPRALSTATRKLIAQGGKPGTLGRRLLQPNEPVQPLVKAVDGLSRDPSGADRSLRRLFDNDPAAAKELLPALAGERSAVSAAADPNAPENQLPAGFTARTIAPPAPVAAAARPVESSRSDYLRSAFAAIASQPLLPQSLRARANLEVSKSMSAELAALPSGERRAGLQASIREFNVASCAAGSMPIGTTFNGQDLGDGFAPGQVATYVNMKGRPGFALIDPKNGAHQTFESLDGRLVVEQIPRSDGRQALVTTTLDAREKVVSRDARIIDPRGYVIEGRLKPDGTFESPAGVLDDETHKHPALVDDHGALYGVVLSDYKKPDLKSLRRAGFLDNTFDAMHDNELLLQLSRIAGMVDAPPQLIRLPQSPGFTDRPGDLALVYDAGGIRHLDRISPAGTHYSVTDAVLDAQGNVSKITACVDDKGACAHQDEFLRVGVSKYDDQGRWTSQGRVKITHDGVDVSSQKLKGDSALDAHLQDARKFLEENKWINWLPKSASFIADRGLDLAYGFEEFENSLLTGKGDVERKIWGDVTHGQEPSMAWSKTPGTDLMRVLQGDLGPELYGRFRKALADAYRKGLLKTAADPQQALALSEGSYACSDEEIGQFIRSGDAGLGFHGIATAAAEAAHQTDSMAAKIGYHAFGAGATFTEIGAQGLAFEGVGFGLKALGSIGKASEVLSIAPLAEGSAGATAAAQTSSLMRGAKLLSSANQMANDLYFKFTMPLDQVSALVRAHEDGDQVELAKVLYQVGALGSMNALNRVKEAAAPKSAAGAQAPTFSDNARRFGFQAGAFVRSGISAVKGWSIEAPHEKITLSEETVAEPVSPLKLTAGEQAGGLDSLKSSLETRGQGPVFKAAENLYYTDPLTGLPNRAFYADRAAASLEGAKNPTVAMLDMNNFGAVNVGLADLHGVTRGRAQADAVLGLAGATLGQIGRAHGVTVIRLGGEEFVALGSHDSVVEFSAAAKQALSPERLLDEAGMARGGADRSSIAAAMLRMGRARQPVADFTYGVAELRGRPLQDAVSAADLALAHGKDSAGRGAITLETPKGYQAWTKPSDAMPLETLPRAPPARTAQRVADLEAQLTPNERTAFREAAFKDPLTGTLRYDYVALEAPIWDKAYPDGGEAVVSSARNLKQINDILGHDAGDLYLSKLGAVIHATVELARTQDHLDVQEPVRVGSKEFLLVGRDAVEVTRRVQAEVSRKFAAGQILPAEMVARVRSESVARGAVPSDRAGLIGTMRAISEPIRDASGRADVRGALDRAFVGLETAKADEAAPSSTPAATAKTAPLKRGQAIIDSNIAISIERAANGEVLEAGQSAFIKGAQGLGLELRLTEKSLAEVGARPAAVRDLGERVPITVSRDSPEYADMIRRLGGEKMQAGTNAVGGRKGSADRTIVADVFFAQTEAGVTPVFVTGDGNVYKKLALLGGTNPETGQRILPEKLGKPVAKAFPKGFPVTIAGRTIWVIPVSE